MHIVLFPKVRENDSSDVVLCGDAIMGLNAHDATSCCNYCATDMFHSVAAQLLLTECLPKSSLFPTAASFSDTLSHAKK